MGKQLNLFGRITSLAIKRRKIVYFVIMLVLIFGAMNYQSMTKSIFPDVKFPYIAIATSVVGASAEDVETMVTNPIEATLQDVTDVKKVTSISTQGYSEIVIKFNESVNVSDKMQQLQSGVNGVLNKLPKTAERPIIEEYQITKFPIIVINIKDNRPYKTMNTITKELKQRLAAVEGVNDVSIVGLNQPEIIIEPDKDKMQQYGIVHQDIIEAVNNDLLNIPLGKINMNNMIYGMQSDNRVESLDDIEKLMLLKKGNKSLFIGNVANVKIDTENNGEKTYYVTESEKERVINLLVYKDKKADAVSINKTVKEIVDEYTKETGEDVTVTMDLSVYITRSIQDVVNNAFGGLLSVIVVLFIFINLREALVAAMVIPLTLISSFTLFGVFNLTLNIFTIMGLIIALGMLVDNAIVVIEVIDAERKKESQLSLSKVIVQSANQVAPAIFSSTLTTVLAFIPLAFLSGEEGSLIRVIPIATALAMSLSFIVSVTITPILALQLLSGKQKPMTQWRKIFYLMMVSALSAMAFMNNWRLTGLSLVAAIIFPVVLYIKMHNEKAKTQKKNRYKEIIYRVMHSPILQTAIILTTVFLLIVSVWLFESGAIKQEAMPKVDSQSLIGNVAIIEGTTPKDVDKLFNQIDQYLWEQDYLKEYSCSMVDNKLSYNIELKHKSQRSKHSKIILDELTNYVDSMPNVKAKFIVDGDDTVLDPIVIQVFGENRKLLLDEANRVKEILAEIQGVVAPKVNYDYSMPIVQMEIDRDKASQFDVDINYLLAEVRYLIAGEKLVRIQMNDQYYNIKLFAEDAIKSFDQLEGYVIYNNQGLPVLLQDIVSLKVERSIKDIQHYKFKPMMAISARTTENVSVGEIIEHFNQKIQSQPLVDGLTLEIGGEFAKMNESYSDLAKKFIIAILLVYIVLLVQFNSFTQPFAIILSVPFSIIGVAIGYAIFKITFSTMSFLGIVSLVGIAVNDAIVLIDFINTERKNSKISRLDAIVKGCVSRSKPIIATTLTTMVGILPLAVFSEDYSQMALVLIFGLFGSTLLTLFIIPIVLNIIESISNINLRKKGQTDEEIA